MQHGKVAIKVECLNMYGIAYIGFLAYLLDVRAVRGTEVYRNKIVATAMMQ